MSHFGVLGAGTAAANANNSFNLQPFKINLTSEISRTLDLVNNTRLPETALYPTGQQKELQLDFLLSLRSEWLTSFDWEVQQAELNGFRQFTTVIEGLKIHFVHERSQDPNAIPLVLLHGWGGSFHEFSPVIKPLTKCSTANSAGRNVSYHFVVPSLPGFTFSSPPPENWTNSDSARIFNTLMTEVLGYSTYAVSGTDWGAAIAYDLYNSYNQTVRATHLALLIFLPPTAEEIAEQNITLSEDEQVTERRTAAYFAFGQGYFQEHEFKARPQPDDIGLALYDNPVGQLAWIGSKFKLWRDPQLAGTPPSVLNNTAILTSVSLYYLTRSFLSSVWIYAQNASPWRTDYTKAPTDAPLLFSEFKYNLALWPEEYVAKTGNLVFYKFHNFGGHFAGLDNPPALIEDIREMGVYFKA
ncbi:Alpha/Beta hydrolase protein [Mycena albidolilacea]|uniref:Alpha/Beta hydrolase protein n=1 Tax=Mycena albidolilacea TaxID=1033008 RepID=A0AAD7EF78_9AGAR|nr:Alpha/Beta hydrolase protein [Mycena albidolilacea]